MIFKKTRLSFFLNLAFALIVISSAILLLFDKALNQNMIRTAGILIYVLLMVVLFYHYYTNKSKAAMLFIGTLATQGALSMVANAAFGFQAQWFSNPRVYDAILAYITSFKGQGSFAFLIIFVYVVLLVSSVVAALAAYVMAGIINPEDGVKE